MDFHLLAEATVVVHAGFLVFLLIGGLLALRWRRVLWPHLAAAVWSLGIVTIGQPCPLTSLERWARRRDGQVVSSEGFIDTYVRGIVFPGQLTSVARIVLLVVVAGSWLALYRQRSRPAALVRA